MQRCVFARVTGELEAGTAVSNCPSLPHALRLSGDNNMKSGSAMGSHVVQKHRGEIQLKHVVDPAFKGTVTPKSFNL